MILLAKRMIVWLLNFIEVCGHGMHSEAVGDKEGICNRVVKLVAIVTLHTL
jgi:hypothetical protein